jgi:hypothetical protein
MIRIASSPVAFEAIAATQPLGSVGYENEISERSKRYVWSAPNVVDRLRAMPGPGDSVRPLGSRAQSPGVTDGAG